MTNTNSNIVRLTESQLRQVIAESVKRVLSESLNGNDYSGISDMLDELGWAYSDCYEVTNRNTGQSGMRYILETYPQNLNGIKPVDVETLKSTMIERLGADNVIFSEGQNRFAPEMKNISMIVLDN